MCLSDFNRVNCDRDFMAPLIFLQKNIFYLIRWFLPIVKYNREPITGINNTTNTQTSFVVLSLKSFLRMLIRAMSHRIRLSIARMLQERRPM
jgi:hypothetical protein